MTPKQRDLLEVIHHYGGAGMGTIELEIQSGYVGDDLRESALLRGAFMSVARSLQRRGYIRIDPDGMEITERGLNRGGCRCERCEHERLEMNEQQVES